MSDFDQNSLHTFRGYSKPLAHHVQDVLRLDKMKQNRRRLEWQGDCTGRLVPLGSHCVGAPWGGTLSTTMDAKPMSNVACEGSHMKDFGGIGLINRNHLIPSPF